MENLAPVFPVISNYTYLDTPATGLISKSILDFRKRQYANLWQKGSLHMEENAELNDLTREKIASFFNGQPQETALVPAFSFGLNAILESLASTTHILLLSGDYPSINLAVEARDFVISYAAIDENIEDRIYQAFKKEQPDVFVFSLVQYLNGIKIDLSFLKTLKEEFPETLFIADGTQYLGTESFDFKNSGLDVLGASAYKWIGAGWGNGFFMFQPGLNQRIDPKYVGFGSTLGKYKEKGDTLIGKLEGNHLDISNMGSLKVALQFHEEVGLKRIWKQVNTLSDAAKTAFADRGLLEEAVVNRKAHSSIFNLKGDEAQFEKLRNNNVLCSQRGEGIRVGFHYYNTLEDLERLLNVWKA